MEMHQVRYFLSVARRLNFTRAAEECNVAQPSLTRAIKLLEAEFGGELFRRERNLSHLTELGQRVLPLLKQCYESSLGAKSVAVSIRKGEVAPLRIALSRTVDISLLIDQFTEVARAFRGIEFKFIRDTAANVCAALKNGDADLGIACARDESWDRFDAWPLFSESFEAAVSGQHPLARTDACGLSEVLGERILVRTYCENSPQFVEIASNAGVTSFNRHEVTSERDLAALVAAGLGIAIVPRTTSMPEGVIRLPIKGLELDRTVYLYGVAGRQRSDAANALLKLLRSHNWARHLRPNGPSPSLH
jgi:DNA-binding transcriptional LysR family regulator